MPVRCLNGQTGLVKKSLMTPATSMPTWQSIPLASGKKASDGVEIRFAPKRPVRLEFVPRSRRMIDQYQPRAHLRVPPGYQTGFAASRLSCNVPAAVAGAAEL